GGVVRGPARAAAVRARYRQPTPSRAERRQTKADPRHVERLSLAQRRQVPATQTVSLAKGQPGPVGADGDLVDTAVQVDLPDWDHPLQFPGLHVPEAQGVVVTARHERLAVRADGERRHPARMPGQHTEWLPGRGIPQSHELVPATGGDPAPVGTEDDRVDVASVPPDARGAAAA